MYTGSRIYDATERKLRVICLVGGIDGRSTRCWFGDLGGFGVCRCAKTVLVPIELGTRAFGDSDVSRVCNMYDL